MLVLLQSRFSRVAGRLGSVVICPLRQYSSLREDGNTVEVLKEFAETLKHQIEAGRAGIKEIWFNSQF